MFTVPFWLARYAWPRRWAPALALCAVFVGVNSRAEGALALEQALQLAQQRSAQLVAQDAGAAASREMSAAASALPDPVLKTGLYSVPISGPDRFSFTRDSFTMLSVGVAQEFTRADKRKARAGRFDREAEMAEAGRAVALANLRRDTATAWLDRLYQERTREVLLAQRAEAGLQIEAAEASYRGGRGTQADVFAARSAVAQIDDRIRQTDKQIATSRTRLARWVAEGANQALGAAPNLATVPFDATSLETELAHHPQIALMVRQEALAQAEVDIALSNKRSDWSAELTYSQRGRDYSNMVSFNVSIPLQWDQTNRQDREVAAKLALVRQMRAQREDATRDHVAQVRAWLQEWHANRDRLTHYDGTLIPLAGERTRAALAAYRGGAGPLSAVLEARRIAIDTHLERLRLDMETAGVWAQLEYLIPARHDTAVATEK